MVKKNVLLLLLPVMRNENTLPVCYILPPLDPLSFVASSVTLVSSSHALSLLRRSPICGYSGQPSSDLFSNYLPIFVYQPHLLVTLYSSGFLHLTCFSDWFKPCKRQSKTRAHL